MELKAGSSSHIPYPDNSFDKVCTINCIYFWPDPLNDLKEILRVMKDNGKLVISVYKKEKMQELPQTRYGFRLYSGNQFQDLFTQAGFKESTIVNANLKLGEATFVVGTKK
jgi:ubiquinone/menaquinone biosynthesis C-methylase UbiE